MHVLKGDKEKFLDGVTHISEWIATFTKSLSLMLFVPAWKSTKMSHDGTVGNKQARARKSFAEVAGSNFPKNKRCILTIPGI